VVIGVALMCLAGAVVMGGMSLVHGPAEPKRQVARIMILPDTPPPPPPDDKKPPPPKDVQTPQALNMPVPKLETPPEPAQLKMEGEAGEGPSMFASGEVRQDYIGGDIGNGSRYAAYVARLEQRVQAELSRHKLHVANIKLFVWLAPDGAIQRYSVQGGDGDATRSVREAMAELTHVDEAPQPDMPMPVGLSIN
jgi:protein TonB